MKSFLILLMPFCFQGTLPLWGDNVSKDFLRGMDAFDSGHYKKSIKIFKGVLKDNPSVSHLSRVQYQIGLAYEALDKYKKAFNAYETVFKKYPDIRNPEEIIEREFLLAEKYEQGEIRKILGIDFAESAKTALEIYAAVIKNSPFGPRAEESLLRSIRILLQRKDYDKALEKINVFTKNYETSPLLDEVSFLGAKHYFLQKHDTSYDQANTEQALEKLTLYLRDFPEGQFVVEARETISELEEILAESFFQKGQFYIKDNNSKAANKYFQDIVDRFPDSRPATQAMEYLQAGLEI